MRISDWSSDVCSSDLLHVEAESAIVLWDGQAEQAEVLHLLQQIRRNLVLLLQPILVGNEALVDEARHRIGELLKGIAVQRHYRTEERRGGIEGVRECGSR